MVLLLAISGMISYNDIIALNAISICKIFPYGFFYLQDLFKRKIPERERPVQQMQLSLQVLHAWIT